MSADEGSLGRFSTDNDSYRRESEFEEEFIFRADIPWGVGDGPPVRSEPVVKVAQVSGRRKKVARKSDRDRSEAPPLHDIIIGSSIQAQSLRDSVHLYAENSAPVLIAGETGVGKELVARELHRRSNRNDKPFVALNAGAIPTALASSELFGHRKGAFTGAHCDQTGAIAAAEGGVLFLDEIGDTPLEVQAYLLRVLDDGKVTKLGSHTPTPVDFRLVAATNVDLRKNVANGTFRQDLYHRLDVLIIEVPPLRERLQDVIEIGEALIRTLPEASLNKSTITPRAADRLMSYHYPGNVRELRNVLTRAAVRAAGGKILPEHISFSNLNPSSQTGVIGVDISKARDLVTRFVVMKALMMTDGNVTKAAELTGRGRSTIHEMKKQINGGGVASEFESVCAEMRTLLSGC